MSSIVVQIVESKMCGRFLPKEEANQSRHRKRRDSVCSFLESEFEMLCVVCVPMALKFISRKGFLTVNESNYIVTIINCIIICFESI